MVVNHNIVHPIPTLSTDGELWCKKMVPVDLLDLPKVPALEGRTHDTKIIRNPSKSKSTNWVMRNAAMPRLWVSRPLQMISRDFRGFLSGQENPCNGIQFLFWRGAVKTRGFVRKWIQVDLNVCDHRVLIIFDQFAIRKIWQNRSKRHFTAHLSRTHLVVFTRKTWGRHAGWWVAKSAKISPLRREVKIELILHLDS